jgi:CDP-glucose 4,6-dehydratase
VPDVLRAFARGEPVVVRNPMSTRPWQHVLEPLSGYLTLAERLWHDGPGHAEGWNFGPRDEDARSVQWIVEYMAAQWGAGARWELDADSHPHEAHHLKLDISKAGSRLGWRPRWALPTALDNINTWHRAWLAGGNARQLCMDQIRKYTEAAEKEPT